MKLLDIRAGVDALPILRRDGLQADAVDLLIGASGGPKWLVLLGIDQWLAGTFLPARTRAGRLPLLGASIGAWRLAALATPSPALAQAGMLEAYLAQQYSAQPTTSEVSAQCRAILEAYLPPADIAAVIAHRRLQLHVLVTGVQGLAASTQRRTILAGMAAAGLRQLVSPRWTGGQLERVVFHTGVEPPWTRDWNNVPTRHLPLDPVNLIPVLLASGSIPLLLDAVRLAAYPAGALYDGGILDYHPLPRRSSAGLVLYPHFFPRVVPGWFDKQLRWRHTPRAALRRTVVISPAAEWVASLPGGRIPDRHDFTQLDAAERVARWTRIAAESERLGDALVALSQRGDWAAKAQPL